MQELQGHTSSRLTDEEVVLKINLYPRDHQRIRSIEKFNG